MNSIALFSPLLSITLFFFLNYLHHGCLKITLRYCEDFETSPQGIGDFVEMYVSGAEKRRNVGSSYL